MAEKRTPAAKAASTEKAAGRKAVKAAKSTAQAEGTTDAVQALPGSRAARRGPQEPKLAQHPSLLGKPEVEIAERSQDVDEPASEKHRKVFVVPKNKMGPDYDDDMHARNIDAMRQGMVNQGLRPTSPGEFVEATDHPDGHSVCLVYEVDAIPAAIAEPPLGMVRIPVADDAELARDRAAALEEA